MILYVCILFSVLFFYFITISLFAYGWINTPTFSPDAHENISKCLISVVIALRNEEENLPELLSSLMLQDYPNNKLEVILINDHSRDSSVSIINQTIYNRKNYKLINLPEEIRGKKAAISLGYEKANGELIAITDADCIIQPDWISTLNSFYQNRGNPDVINGLVDMTPANGIMQKSFRLDFLSLLVSSVGAAFLNHPIFNNAANLSIKKNLAINLNLQNKLASGDDVFLLHEFKKQKKRIEVLKNNKHLIKTSPPQSLSEFFWQRMRWASKASSYTDRDAILISWLVFLTNLILLSAYFVFPISGLYKPLLLTFGVKLLADLFLFLSCRSFFNLKISDIVLVPVLEIVYPCYIVSMAIYSKIKPFQWKGRILN